MGSVCINGHQTQFQHPKRSSCYEEVNLSLYIRANHCYVLPQRNMLNEWVTDGLVSYWTFDRQDIVGKTARDVWGENDGTIVGNPKVAKGYVREALKLDGPRDYVNLTNLGDFGTRIGEATFEAWVKTDFKKNWMTLFKVIDSGCAGWGMDFNASKHPDDGIVFDEDVINLYIRYKIGENGCGISNSGRSFSISDGEWHHIAYVQESYVDEAEREWRVKVIYIDGERRILSRSTSTPKPIFSPFTESVYLGAGNNRGRAEGFFRGIVDEVRIYTDRLPMLKYSKILGSKIGFAVKPAQKLPTVWGALKTKL